MNKLSLTCGVVLAALIWAFDGPEGSTGTASATHEQILISGQSPPPTQRYLRTGAMRGVFSQLSVHELKEKDLPAGLGGTLTGQFVFATNKPVFFTLLDMVKQTSANEYQELETFFRTNTVHPLHLTLYQPASWADLVLQPAIGPSERVRLNLGSAVIGEHTNLFLRVVWRGMTNWMEAAP